MVGDDVRGIVVHTAARVAAAAASGEVIVSSTVKAIVPPKPRVLELRVMRRLKTRRALQTCVGAAASALVSVLLSPTDSYAAPLMILMGVAFVSGVSAVVLRFVEQPREIIVRKVEHEREPPLIH